MTARLIVVPTPLGNLDDLTLRAADALRSVGWVACEDTRVTRRVLSHLGAHPRLISVREQNEAAGADEVRALLSRGETVAYCTDAGMPVVSDPGSRLVAEVRAAGFPVVVLPGATAVTTALAGSGLPGDRFHFAGFLPARDRDRDAALERLRALDCTLVLYEAPHRLRATLAAAARILGDRHAVVCRELSKKHEEYLDTTLAAAAEREGWRGEITLVIAGATPSTPPPPDPATISAWLRAKHEEHPEEGVKSLAARVAERFGIGKREAYALALEIRKGD